MNNPIVLKTVSIIAFVISAIFTILLMTSGTVGILAFVLTVGMSIVLELCKCGFMYEALSNARLNGVVRSIMAVISLLLVASSIFASASYVQNQANKTKNIQVKDSTQYKQLEQGKVIQQDLYNSKKKEIEDLKALQQQQKLEGEKIVNAMPKNYIDRRNNQRALTQNQVSETQKIINDRQTELSQLGASLQNPIDTTNLKLKNDSGYTAMFQTISDLINSSAEYKDKPIKPETLEMWFFISLAIIFELVAVLTAYLSQIKGVTMAIKTQFNSQADNLPIGFKPRFTMSQVNPQDTTQGEYIHEPVKETRIIGFYQEPTASTPTDKIISVGKSHKHSEPQSTQSNIDNKILGIYLDYVYNNVKEDNSVPGYVVTAKDLNLQYGLSLSNDYIRKLKNHAEQLNILQSDSNNRKTYIIKPKDELKALKV
jgi:hypothetical protein